MKILFGFLAQRKSGWRQNQPKNLLLLYFYLFICLFLDEVLWMNQQNTSVPSAIRTALSMPTAILSSNYGIIQETFCAIKTRNLDFTENLMRLLQISSTKCLTQIVFLTS